MLENCIKPVLQFLAIAGGVIVTYLCLAVIVPLNWLGKRLVDFCEWLWKPRKY